MVSVMRGVIFDLDGTLVDTGLDFDAMRLEMDLPPGEPIWETLETLPADRAARCREILLEHERRGADRATAFPGVPSLLQRLRAHGLKLAVLTRNSRQSAQAVLSRLALRDFFSHVITRDDGPVKPDPWAIRQVCAAWHVSPAETAVVGDFVFDVLTGRKAGAATVFFTQGREPDGIAGAADADYILRSFERAHDFFAWLTESA
jgi:HAD superfamily hydrolase (TIGR01509 family)